MQGLHSCTTDFFQLDLSPPVTTAAGTHPAATNLSIEESEPAEARIRRIIGENPVVIFSRAACCMCHVMKSLLSAVGVHPTVIELDDHEIAELPNGGSAAAPAVFIGGSCVGGLESLVALHLGGHLVPKLVEVGAFWV